MTYEELMNNREFLEKLYEAQDVSSVRELFASQGVQLTEEELMRRMLPTGDTLTEEQLETVSGGGSVITWFRSRLGRASFGGGGRMGGR